MLTEVFPGIYKTVLHNATVEQGVSEINIFLIPGRTGERSLMVDTGFHQESCRRQLEEALAALSIPVSQLDIFLTHRHHDHCGLAGDFARRGARLYMNPEEERHPYDCITYRPTGETAEAQRRVLRYVGVTREETPALWASFERVSAEAEKQNGLVLAITSFPYTAVRRGDRFRYSDYHFRAIPLRGHTYGQLGLMDEEKQLFFSADQLINGVTPIVATTYPDEALLQSFFDSLEYVKRRCTEGWTVLPAHGDTICGGAALRDAVDRSVFSYLEKCSRVKELLAEEERVEQERSRDGAAKQAADLLWMMHREEGERTVRELMELCYHVEEEPSGGADFFKYKMTLTKTFSILEYLYGIDFITRKERDGILYWSLRRELPVR